MSGFSLGLGAQDQADGDTVYADRSTGHKPRPNQEVQKEQNRRIHVIH